MQAPPPQRLRLGQLGVGGYPADRRGILDETNGDLPPSLGNRSARSRVAAGVALVLLCATAGALIATQGDSRQSYLVLTTTVPAGEQLSTSDLATVSVSTGSGLGVIPAVAEPSVLGEIATTTLVAGSLLSPAELATASPVSPGEAIVGAALSPGELPATGLAPGEDVLVVLSGSTATTVVAPASGSSGALPPVGGVAGGAQGSPGASGLTPDELASAPRGTVLGTAVVYAVLSGGASSAPGGSGVAAVSLELPLAEAPSVVAASAANEISLAVLASPARGNKRSARAGTPRT